MTIKGLLIALSCIWITSTRGNEFPYLDESVNPCDDFYKFTCGNFKNVHPIPEGALNIDHFSILQEEIHVMAERILKAKVNPDEPQAVQKAKTFYAACLDLGYLDSLFIPSLAVLDSFGEWPVIDYKDNARKKLSWAEIGDIIADYGISFFFDMTTTSSHFNATANVIYISKDSMLNPDAGVIGKIPEDLDLLAPGKQSRGATEKLPYHQFLSSIAFRLRDIRGTFKSDKAINKEVEESIMYLRYISGGGIIPGDLNITTLPNEATIAELQEWTYKYFGENSVDWLEFLNHAFKYSGVTITKDMKVMMGNNSQIYGMLNLYKMSDSDTVKNYVIGRLLTHMAPDSDAFMRYNLQKFYKALGYPVYERSEYCLRKTLGYPGYTDFSIAVTYEYQRYHFNINKLQKAAEMVIDLQYSFLDILDNADWMDDESRLKAKSKARNIITLLGYPDYAEDKELLDEYYENLRICSWDHFGNSQRLRAFRRAINMRDIGFPKNRELWNISPLDVNAFYNRANNRILFPVAILNPIFFSGESSLLDYARIGAVIGHEITHGFDATGSLYSEQGILANWWSRETFIAFGEKTGCFEDQYFGYYIEEIDKYVNGTQTLNENLADNGGLRAAYLAYQSLRKRSAPVENISGYTDEQLFFIGYGSMWCMTETEYYLDQMRKTQPYSPGRYRVEGPVSNMEEFSQAFNCPVGSRMNPKDKCILW